MKILVLGTGFLGIEIVSCCLNKEYQVLPARLSGKPINLNGQELETVAIDVLDPQTFDKIPEDITHVVYSVSARNGSEESYKNAYFLGIKNISDFLHARGIGEKITFLLISSTGVFLENEGGVVNEESTVQSTDKKYSHLLNGEQLVLSQFGQRGLVLRLSGIYGKGRRYFVKLAEVLSENLNKTKDEDLKINWSNRIHKTDAARATCYLMEKKCSGIFIVSDDLPCVNLDAIKGIQAILKIKVLDLNLEKIKNIAGKRCDNSKLKKQGFQFTYPTYKEGYEQIILDWSPKINNRLPETL